MDFYKVAERVKKAGVYEVYPDFKVCHSRDLMVRGKSFYAIWDEEKGLWSTDEYDVQRLVDNELYDYVKRRPNVEGVCTVLAMGSFSSGSWVQFKKYVNALSDNSHPLDDVLTFADTKVTRDTYASKRLPYSMSDGPCEAYDALMKTLYDSSEREKLEWAIGSVIAGDSRYIQKFIVLYGEAGSGKSTVLNIIQKLFQGYYTTFEAKALVGGGNTFAMEPFKGNPLVAIEHDSDLSYIEDNTRLNSIVSHEEMVMNEKFKAAYPIQLHCFLFLGTNKPVRITDAKSGLIRRLIDVTPSGRKLAPHQYESLMNKINFELGQIANRCLSVYKKLGINHYAQYRPMSMMKKTDVFYNFVEANYDEFDREDGVTLNRAYDIYKMYCDDALVDHRLPKHKFREELKNYFERFEDRKWRDGKSERNYYSGFLRRKFNEEAEDIPEPVPDALVLESEESEFDRACSDCPAQYASERETPIIKWSDCTSKLADLDTRRTHFAKPPVNLICIDFDLRDEQGNKSAKLNLEAAAKWPKTYAEFSKSGQGVHLYYWYDGDVSKLSALVSPGIEVKVFTGGASLRRKLTKCNSEPIAHINSGLPLKEEKVVNFKVVKSEKALRDQIRRNLNKEIHDSTRQSINFIKKILDDAYDSGLHYDVSDMQHSVLLFAMHSTNHADYCVKLVPKMKFKSEEPSDCAVDYDDSDIVFFDCEVFPNLFVVNYKLIGDSPCVRLINPSPARIEELMKLKLVGFNCRRYDNHILYARYLGWNNEQLFVLSQRIVSGESGCMLSEAYNLSYADVYDFSSKKQSLKKFEIELGIHHMELGLPWDKPVPEDMWERVAEYCDNDVKATEAVFNARKADWTARKILAEVAGMSVNDTTNSLTTRIIFGKDKAPQSKFNYRFMGEVWDHETYRTLDGCDANYCLFDGGKPIFPGYRYESGKSTYRGEEVGEGGYVYAEPGIYYDVALLDIASMHPSSIVAETLFGDEYTARFKEILDARIAIKHGDFEKAKTMLDGKLSKYLTDESTAKDLAQALKIAINSVYGLTAAHFDTPFRDKRNIDNIVAKRGALFMVNLKHEVQNRGFTVAHIKTDSIKIPNATPEIIKFVMDFGKEYGYTFEHEATYERMCLVNDAVYIARYKDGKNAGEWVAVGAQFQQPIVFKTLFSKEPITFSDLCEPKSVTSAMYLNMGTEEEPNYHFVGKTGLFCPMKKGGGILVREKDGKYSSVTGTKGYLWLESETVLLNNRKDDIDMRYFRELVDEARAAIDKFGDVEEFIGTEEVKS